MYFQRWPERSNTEMESASIGRAPSTTPENLETMRTSWRPAANDEPGQHQQINTDKHIRVPFLLTFGKSESGSFRQQRGIVNNEVNSCRHRHRGEPETKDPTFKPSPVSRQEESDCRKDQDRY